MAEKHEIDNIAKRIQQRRSPAPKPRTDFSFFLLQSSSSSSSSQESMRDSSSAKEALSTSSIATSDDKKRTAKGESRLPLVQCKKQVSGRQSSRRQLFRSPNGSNTSNEQDQSCDRQNSSGSIQSDSDFIERRRSKRTRKPKLHFDETSILLSPGRKDRRFKIMRHLGLIAPVGSPFSLTHV